MTLPRNLFGRKLADHLIGSWQHREDRQTGSHIHLESTVPPAVHLAISAHKPLKIGTLHSILRGVAQDRSVTIEEILRKL